MFFELDADRRFCDYRIPAGIVPFADPRASMGRTIDEVLPPDLASRVHQAADAVLADRSPRHLDYALTLESGVTHSYRASIATRGARDAPHYVVLVREVTDLVEARRELESAMALNRRLVGEMNHRVKNNLAMVSSLIHLKEQMLADSAGLSDLRRQIDAIRFIHEHLQASEGGTVIEARSYLERLVTEVATLAAGATVLPRVEADDASLPSRTATSVGLIVTELATNAIKHGLNGTPSPEIVVTLKQRHDTWLLQVSNNGSPIPDGVDLATPRSFGLQLVTGLVSQLGGELDVTRSPNPAFTITFPVG